MTNTTETPNQNSQGGDEREQAARRYALQLRVFHVHAVVFAGSMAIIIAVNLFVNLQAGIADEWSAWWSIWALIGWGAGVAVHGFVVWLNRPLLSSSTLEQRKFDRNDYQEPPVAAEAKYKKQVRALQGHAGAAAGSLTIIFSVNLLTNLSAGIADEWSAWWSLWAILGSGAGLGVHAFVVWLNRPAWDS